MLSQQLAQSLKRVRLAGEARKAYVQAEAESLRNSLLSAISHDLRTPLTRIMGTASALAEPNESLSPVERYELAGEIRDEARHMADLMSKILDMARLTAGTLVLQREWNALEEIVGSALNRLDALLRGRPVRVELPEHLPLIRVDAVLLQQVLVNLVENAAKYSLPGSSIDIAAQCAPAALRIVVADRGQGVPAEFRGRLFEKFYRGVPESAQSGVGLGLALCRAIMEAHGGGIGVEPRPGGGSLFLLTLPLEEQPPGLDFEDPLEAAP
jgi:two-component system sensor histidine kinase KdpD